MDGLNNQTKAMTKLSDIQVKRFDVLLETEVAIPLAIFSSLVYSLNLFVSINVFRLLARKKGRDVNRIIFYQQVTQIVYGLNYIYYIVHSFIYPMADLIGSLGCYINDIISLVGFTYTNSASFFVTLYRYICINHTSFLHGKGISPKVNKTVTKQSPDPLWPNQCL